MSLKDIADVQINVENSTVSRASFGTLLFLGAHKYFTERVRTYTSVQSLLNDGFAPTSDEVAAATALFSQNVTPVNIKIGRRQSDRVIVTPSIVADATLYTVTIDGTPVSFTSGVAATAATITAGLQTAIAGAGTAVTATDLTGTLQIDPTVAATPYTVSTTANLSVAVDLTGAETLTAAIAAVRAEDDEFYVLTTDSHVAADVAEVAGVVETLKKIYLYSTADADTLTTAGTDIFKTLKSLTYDRSAGLHDPDADTLYPEVAWAGVMLPKDPGSATWAHKTLVGQDADVLSETARQNVLAQSGNVYLPCAGRSITQFGTVASGEYLDIIRGIDWLESRIQESVFINLVNLDKIPYTNAGVAIVENAIRANLRDAQTAGVLALDPDFTVTTPDVATISATVKATRCLPSVTFTATLQGAIHKAIVRGTVSV